MMIILTLITRVDVGPALRVDDGTRYMPWRFLLCVWRQLWTVSRFVHLFRVFEPGRSETVLQLATLVS